MRRLLLRWLGAADAGHVAALHLRVQEQGYILTGIAVERTLPGNASLSERCDAWECTEDACRAYLERPAVRLPQIRMRPPADDRALAIVWCGLLVLLFTALIMLVCSCTIRGSRDYDEAPVDMAPADLAADICGTLLPGRMP